MSFYAAMSCGQFRCESKVGIMQICAESMKSSNTCGFIGEQHRAPGHHGKAGLPGQTLGRGRGFSGGFSFLSAEHQSCVWIFI